MRYLWPAIAARTLLISALVPSVVLGQGSTAQINGVVRDDTAGALPGATVTATQTDTGFQRVAGTDDAGAYTLPNLPMGPYRLDVTLAGFRTYVQTGITLQVNANPVINVTLSLGRTQRNGCRRGGCTARGNAHDGNWPGHRKRAHRRAPSQRAQPR